MHVSPRLSTVSLQRQAGRPARDMALPSCVAGSLAIPDDLALGEAALGEDGNLVDSRYWCSASCKTRPLIPAS